MPRSYREWMNEKRRWLWDQAERTRHIEIPDSPILYQRDSDNPYWQDKRDPFIEAFPTDIQLQFNIDKIQTYMENAAEAEEQKETDFLNRFDKTHQDLSNIERFNILFEQEDLYKEMSARIENVLQKSRNDEGKSKEEREYNMGMAPNFFSIYTTYFMDQLEKFGVPKFYKQIEETDTPQMLEEKFEAILQETTYKTVDHIVNKAGYNPDGSKKRDARTEHYGYGNEFEPILKLMQDTSSTAKADFAHNMRAALGFDKMEMLKNAIFELKKSGIQKYGFKKIVKENLGNVRAKTYSYGGTVAEVGAAAIFNQVTQNLNENWQAHGAQIGGPTVMSDMVYLFTGDLTVDLQKVLNEMRVAMVQGTTQNMTEVYKRLEKIQNEWKQKGMEDLYSVFVNSKNYDLRAGAYNYTKKYDKKMEELPEFLDSMDIKIGNIHDFLWLVYNTGENALGNDRREEIQNNITNALKAAAAKVMFDDYQEIGKIDSHNIHLYYLSGQYVPSSTVLKEAAAAVRTARERTRARITLPGPIEDHGPIWPEIEQESKSNAEFKENLLKHWKKEIEDAKTESTWHLEFTLAIRTILKGIHNIK